MVGSLRAQVRPSDGSCASSVAMREALGTIHPGRTLAEGSVLDGPFSGGSVQDGPSHEGPSWTGPLMVIEGLSWTDHPKRVRLGSTLSGGSARAHHISNIEL